MDIRKLQRAIVDGLEDVKAHDIRIYDTEHLSPLFERVIVASGTSNRQTRAIAASVRDTVKSRGLPLMSVEGEDNGEWIIVDCGAAVAHIMQPAIRQYYNLEEIWGGKAVRMKLGGDGPAHARALPVKEPVRASSRRASAAASEASAGGSAGGKSAGTRNATNKKATARNPAGKSTSARNAAGKNSTARNAGTRTAARKNAAGKIPSTKRAAPAKSARAAKSGTTPASRPATAARKRAAPRRKA